MFQSNMHALDQHSTSTLMQCNCIVNKGWSKIKGIGIEGAYASALFLVSPWKETV